MPRGVPKVLQRPPDPADWVKLAERHLAKESLVDFCRLTDNSYEPARHQALVCEHLEAVERGDIDRLIVEMPPRHGKTLHVSERFPAWCLGRHPEWQLILTSYAAELAEQSSRKARNLLEHPDWPWPEVKLAEDSAAVHLWHTTAGGVVRAAGVGGGLGGFGAHLLVIDDYFKNPEQANSETTRQQQWDWYTEVVRARLMPKGRIIICTTRWHHDDIVGRILSGPNASRWTELRLPARAEPDDPLGRPEGAPLWPEWFDDEALAEIERDLTNELGARGWWALYQQRPQPLGGGMFKRFWWRRYSLRAAWEEGLRAKLLVVDTGNKVGLTNDYTACSVWGELHGRYYVMDAWRGRVEYPALKRYVRHLQGAWGCPVVVEDRGNGTALIQDLKRREVDEDGQILPAIPVIPFEPGKASKQARAELATPLVEAGLVSLPDDAEWAPAWIEEHAQFPAGQHDDFVDTTGMAIARLKRRAGDLPIGRTVIRMRSRSAWRRTA